MMISFILIPASIPGLWTRRSRCCTSTGGVNFHNAADRFSTKRRKTGSLQRTLSPFPRGVEYPKGHPRTNQGEREKLREKRWWRRKISYTRAVRECWRPDVLYWPDICLRLYL